jgi:Caspase domain
VRCRLVCVALLAALAAGHAVAQPVKVQGEDPPSDRRIALVIGNAAYSVGRLTNPALDARSMAETLRELGFEVLAHENLTYRAMRRAVAEFGERLSAGGVGLFYYSGHGLQVSGKNYLVPVDADIKSERYVTAEAIDADSVLLQMQEAKTRVNIVVLDACRDNPFAGRFRGLGRGLAFMDVPAGTYVAYATAPGSLAEDGEPGRNGIYTSELLRALREPGLRIEDVFKRVRIAVQARTKNRQSPWDASSMTGEFVFKPPALAAAPPVVAPTAVVPTPAAVPPPATSAVPAPVIREEMRPEMAALALTARVDGVEIFLDGQSIGVARLGRALVVDNLPVGAHRVRAQRAGYKTWESEVQLGPSQRFELVIDLEMD